MDTNKMLPIEEELKKLRESLNQDSDLAFLRQGSYHNASYVRVTEDGMEAYLYLIEPKEEYTKEELLTFLADNNVVYGINQSNLSAIVKKKVYDREIKIAEGFPAITGMDGYYDYFFAPEALAKKPAVREDGSVDYTSMTSLQNVKRGDRVAEYHPAVQGEEGYTVTGTAISPLPVKEMRELVGRGIVKEEDGNYYVANTDGKIEIKDGKIDIQTVHEVRGDVDLITGKIEFYGDVVIDGNVGAGVVIRAGRNLTITGTVEACDLFAGGDIVLQRGIQGGEKAKIIGQGSVFAEFIEYTMVKVAGNIQANTILGAEVYAGGQIKVSGKKGAIIGGYTHGLCGVEAQKLGNEVEVRTIVHAGYQPENYEKYMLLKKLEIVEKQKLRTAVEEMSGILIEAKQSGRGLSRVSESRMQRLIAQKDEHLSTLEKIETEKDKYQTEIEKGKGASIIIKGVIYRGSVICMEDARLPILRQDSFMKYIVNCGVISGSVIAI